MIKSKAPFLSKKEVMNSSLLASDFSSILIELSKKPIILFFDLYICSISLYFILILVIELALNEKKDPTLLSSMKLKK